MSIANIPNEIPPIEPNAAAEFWLTAEVVAVLVVVFVVELFVDVFEVVFAELLTVRELLHEIVPVKPSEDVTVTTALFCPSEE